jgi:ribonuclease BN (tRNA processing enzyme)
VTPGASLSIGPFEVRTALLPHWPPNAGVRLEAGQTAIAYTGDAGPSDRLVELARGADLLLAEATFVDEVPPDSRGDLSSARDAAAAAAQAGVGRLVLTHLQPGTDPGGLAGAARTHFPGAIDVALPGLVVDVD